MAMYHSWDSQNAWLRQIHSHNYLHVNPVTAQAAGVADGGWAWVSSAVRSATHASNFFGQSCIFESGNDRPIMSETSLRMRLSTNPAHAWASCCVGPTMHRLR